MDHAIVSKNRMHLTFESIISKSERKTMHPIKMRLIIDGKNRFTMCVITNRKGDVIGHGKIGVSDNNDLTGSINARVDGLISPTPILKEKVKFVVGDLRRGKSRAPPKIFVSAK